MPTATANDNNHRQEPPLSISLKPDSTLNDVKEPVSKHTFRFFDIVGGYKSSLEFSLPSLSAHPMCLQTLFEQFAFTIDGGDSRPIAHYFYSAVARRHVAGAQRPVVRKDGDSSALGLCGDLLGLVRRSPAGISISWVVKLGASSQKDYSAAQGLINAVRVRFNTVWVIADEGSAPDIGQIDIAGGDTLQAGVEKHNSLRQVKVLSASLGNSRLNLNRSMALSCLLLWNFREDENLHLRVSDTFDDPLVIRFSFVKKDSSTPTPSSDGGGKSKSMVATVPPAPVGKELGAGRTDDPSVVSIANESVPHAGRSPSAPKLHATAKVPVPLVEANKAPSAPKGGRATTAATQPRDAPSTKAAAGAAPQYFVKNIVDNKLSGRANEAAHTFVMAGVQLYRELIEPGAVFDMPIAGLDYDIVTTVSPPQETFQQTVSTSHHNHFFDTIILLVHQSHRSLEQIETPFTWSDLRVSAIRSLEKSFSAPSEPQDNSNQGGGGKGGRGGKGGDGGDGKGGKGGGNDSGRGGMGGSGGSGGGGHKPEGGSKNGGSNGSGKRGGGDGNSGTEAKKPRGGPSPGKRSYAAVAHPGCLLSDPFEQKQFSRGTVSPNASVCRNEVTKCAVACVVNYMKAIWGQVVKLEDP